MRIRVVQAAANIAVIIVLGLAMPASGQVFSCCSTNAETQLLLSEFNFREVTVSNAVQYLCEQTEKEHGVKLKMDFDANPPEVHISLPSGLGDDRQWVERELKKQVEEQVARTYVPPRIWSERKITLSLQNVPVCVALEYILGLTGDEIPCQRHGQNFTLGRPQLRKVGRMYRIRLEAWKELERASLSEQQRTEAAKRGTHFDFSEIFFPVHVCLPERRLVIAAGVDSDLEYFNKELADRGWLETTNAH